jgi:hypothetical protein
VSAAAASGRVAVVGRRRRSPLRAADVVEEGAVGDRVDPRDGIGATDVGAAGAMDLGEGVLEDVLGDRPAARHRRQVREEARRDLGVQGAEGGGVAIAVPGHEFGRRHPSGRDYTAVQVGRLQA